MGVGFRRGSLLLAILGIVLFAVEGMSDTLDSAIHLTIESRQVINGSSTQIVQCGLTDILHEVKVTEISLHLQRSCDLDSYHRLARLDIWTQHPVLESKFSKANVSGKIDLEDDSKTYISVSRDTPTTRGHTVFKCVVQGLNYTGHPVTASKIVRESPSETENYVSDHLVKALSLEVENIDRKLEDIADHFDIIESLENTTCTKSLIHSVNNQLRELNGQTHNVSDQLEAIHHVVVDHRASAYIQYTKDEILGDTLDDIKISIGNELKNLTNGLESIRAAFEDDRSDRVKEYSSQKDAILTMKANLASDQADLAGDVTNLADNLQTVETIVEVIHSELKDFSSNMEMMLKALPERNRNWTTTNKNSFFYDLYPTNVFRGRMYLFTKKVQVFNVSTATELCSSHGGYLVEIDDDEEYEFLNTHVKLFGEDFFTGFSDAKNEGKFTHLHSGYIIRINQWADNQPNSYSGEQDCVEMFKDGSGLNDESCIVSDANFICEVPL